MLPIVKSVQQQLAVDYTLNHDYLNILGMSDFINAATKLVLGNESLAIKKSLVRLEFIVVFFMQLNLSLIFI